MRPRRIQLDGLVGRYELPAAPAGGPVRFVITRESDRLFGQVQGIGSETKMEIHPASADAFFQTNGLTIKFTRDEAGRGVKVTMGGIEGRRIR